MTVLGAELVRMLQGEAGLSRDAAARFIQTHTGQPFDDDASYSVGYPPGQIAAHWSKYDRLRIWRRETDGG